MTSDFFFSFLFFSIPNPELRRGPVTPLSWFLMTPGQPSRSEQEKSVSVRALIRGKRRHLTLLNHERVLSGGSAAGAELDGALLSEGTSGGKG